MDNKDIYDFMVRLDRKFTTFAQQAGYEFDLEGNATRVAKPSQVPVVSEKKQAGKFKRPDVNEVCDYMIEKNIVDPVARAESQKFIDYFESVGWIVGGGKKPMKSWKSAVSTWLTRKSEEIKKESKRYSFKQLADGEHLQPELQSIQPVQPKIAAPVNAIDQFALEYAQHKQLN